MQKLNLSTVEPNQIPQILKAQLSLLPDGEILVLEDKVDREPILEELRSGAFSTLLWYGYMEGQDHWVAHVRKMSEENCCGGCCKG